MAYEYHEPVLLQETMEALNIKADGTYLDGTLGGCGHFRALLGALSKEGTAVGIDRDSDALDYSRPKTASAPCQVILEQSRFSEFDLVLENHNIGKIDGAYLDLGVSSYQIDNRERGFSYSLDGDLDMRMNPREGQPARQLLTEINEPELERILSEYGEIHNPRRMARAISKNRGALNTSGDLLRCLKKEYGPNIKPKVLAKLFQALRIAVNDELQELEIFLEKIPSYLRNGGRLVIISYHSLEDRRVKVFFRDAEKSCVCPPENMVCTCNHPAMFKRISRRAVVASDLEVKNNPRARSARLRVAERIVSEENV